MPLELYADSPVDADGLPTAVTTINGAINSSVTSITFASVAALPAVGASGKQSRIAIKSAAGFEDLILLSVAGLVGTVTRGTPAYAHVDGSSVYIGMITAAAVLNNPGPMTTTGDTTYLDASGNIVRRAIGSAADVLTVVAGVPAWAAPASPDLSAYATLTGVQTLTNKTLTTPGISGTDLAPAMISAVGADTDIALRLAPKGLGYLQLGPDTYGIAGWAGTGVDVELQRLTSTEPSTYGFYSETPAADLANSDATGIVVSVTTPGVGAANDLNYIVGVAVDVRSALPSGRTIAKITGGSFSPFAFGGGTATAAVGVYAQVNAESGSIITTGSAYQAYLYDTTPDADTGVVYGLYTKYLNANTFHEAYGFWSEDMAGKSTHGYYLWADSRGVYRIREDDVADGAGNPQAVPALYNPRFTKYTAGAVDHERLVQQWVGNVATIGTEAGGTGTLRAVNVIGASVQVNGAEIATQAYVGAQGFLTAMASHNLLSADHGDATVGTVARGDLITGQGASATWARLAKGTANQVLSMDATATDIVWATPAGGGGGSGDVVGPAASVDHAIVRFDGTTGKLIQGYTSGAPTVSDTGVIQATDAVLTTPDIGVAIGTSVTLTGGDFTSDGFVRTVGGYFNPYASTGAYIYNGALGLGSDVVLGWSDGMSVNASDTALSRDAAGVLAQKNGANAQEFRVYGTTTGSKYLSLVHDGANPILGSSSGALKVNSTAVTPASTGQRYLQIDANGVISSSASAPVGT